MSRAADVIRRLGLQPHPKEGGFFRETYRSTESIAADALPSRYRGVRQFCTAIYYLLTPTTFSALHRLRSDEIFHFYQGGPVRMIQLHPNGAAETIVLGPDLAAGHQLQVVVPRGVWQGSFLESGDYGLLGCTVAPAFDYADYEHGDRTALLAGYPAFTEWITRLTNASSSSAV